MSAIHLPTGGQPLLQRHHHIGQTSPTSRQTGPTRIGTRCLSHRIRTHRHSNNNRLQLLQGSTTMLSIILLVGVSRGGVTTPIRTKHGDGVDGTPNNSKHSNSSRIHHISKILHINRISGEINNGVELISRWVEQIVLVVRHGREDGHKILKISNNNNMNSSMVTTATIRLEATTASHSSSPLTSMVVITRDSPMGARQGSYASHQQTDHREVRGRLLYRSCYLLELTRLGTRGVLLLVGSILHQAAAGERESLRTNELGRISHHHHGRLETDIHHSRVNLQAHSALILIQCTIKRSCVYAPSSLLGVLLPTPSPSYNAVPPPGAASAEATPPSRPPVLPTPSSSSTKTDTADPTATRGKFPPGFSTYVNRAFAACTTADEREKVHEYLDVELNKIFNEKKQWEIDWDTFPLPR